MSQPTEKQINRLFADSKRTNEALLSLNNEVEQLSSAVQLLLVEVDKKQKEEHRKYICVFCGVVYFNELDLDWHLRSRGLH